MKFQFCDVCDPTRPDKMHPPEFAVDGMETWWQSPPLSRGMKYNEVNLTIDLGQVSTYTYCFRAVLSRFQLTPQATDLSFRKIPARTTSGTVSVAISRAL
jgi:hypothetical protein